MIARRELLHGMAAAVVVAAGGGLALGGCAREDRLEPVLRGFFADRDAAREVGEEVLALDPDAANARVLIDRLVRRRGEELRALAGSDPGRLFDALRAQHRDDFAEERVVVVRGWVLSQTEAWLLALAALP